MASLLQEIIRPGLTAVECGCGCDARLSTFLKDARARVLSFDVSYVALSRASASRNSGEPGLFFVNAAAEHLPISNESIDLVVAESALHHFCLTPALAELNRILRIGGICVFREPLRGSPFVRLFRWLTPGDRTSTERPFGQNEFDVISTGFTIQRRTDFFLFAPMSVAVAFISRRLASWLWKRLVLIDGLLVRRFPALRWWCWQTVVVVQKPV
jgi:SAM-dependent methyltransferase